MAVVSSAGCFGNGAGLKVNDGAIAGRPSDGSVTADAAAAYRDGPASIGGSRTTEDGSSSTGDAAGSGGRLDGPGSSGGIIVAGGSGAGGSVVTGGSFGLGGTGGASNAGGSTSRTGGTGSGGSTGASGGSTGALGGSSGASGGSTGALGGSIGASGGASTFGGNGALGGMAQTGGTSGFGGAANGGSTSRDAGTDSQPDAPAPAALAINFQSKDYGTVVTGQFADVTFQISNSGGQPSSIPIVTLSGTDAAQYVIQSNGCAAALPVGQSCSVTVRFSPTSAGTKNADLDVTASTGGSVAATLQGAAVVPGNLTIVPNAPAAFPDTIVTGASVAQVFTITNAGGTSAGTTTPLSIAATGSNASDFAITANTCAAILAPSATCMVSVSFNPSASGARSASLSANAAPGGTAAVALTGTGLTPASLTLATAPGSSTDFGIVRIGSDGTQTFVLANGGTQISSAVTITVTGVDFSLVSPGQGDCISGTTSLAGGKTCSIRVKFSPTTTGQFTGSVGANATTGGSPSTLTLTASALQPPGVFSEYPIAVQDNGFMALTAGSDGNLWFIQNDIGRMLPNGAYQLTFAVIPNDSPVSNASMTVGPDANIWVADQTASSFNKINSVGSLTSYTPFATSAPGPIGISKGPGADTNLWFTQGTNIGKVSTSGLIVATYPILSGHSAYQITAGPDGNIWFRSSATTIGKATPTGTITEYPIPGASGPANWITSGPDGNVWFILTQDQKAGKIVSSGSVALYPLPSPPGAIVGAPDGNIWFTEPNTSKIGRITPTGTVSEFSTPTANSIPYLITVGPSSSVWFTEQAPNNIASITY